MIGHGPDTLVSCETRSWTVFRVRRGPMINSNGCLDSCERIRHPSLKAPRANPHSDRSRQLEANRMATQCAVKTSCINCECPGWGKTLGSLNPKRQVLYCSSPGFLTCGWYLGWHFECLSFIFQSLSPFLWVLLEPTLSYIKKRLDSVPSSSFTWLFVLITVNSFSTKSFHSDIVHMPKSLDRGQHVSAVNALASVNLIYPLQRGTGAHWDS